MPNDTRDVKLYEMPIDSMPLNIAVYRRVGDDFIFVDFNKMAEQTEQITKEELIGKRLTEVFPGVRKFGLFDVLMRVDETGRPETFELNYYSDDRISGWRKNEIIKLPNGDVMAQYRDLTKERQLHALGQIIDHSLNEIYIFDKESLHFTYVNRGASENIGYSLEEMKSMTPIDIKVEYTRDRFVKLITPLLEKREKQVIFETIHRRKDGSEYAVEARLQLMEIDGKEQFVAITLDISERKETQMKLKQSEVKFRTIAENSLMGIFIYTENLVYVNDALVRMSGYGKEELYAMKVWEFVDVPLRKRLQNTVSRRLRGEYFPRQYDDVKVYTKYGVEKTVRVMTQTIPYEDGFAGLGTIIDITDIKETKQRLKLLAQAIEQTDDLVRITDIDGVMTYVNDSLVAHSGYMRAELIGQNARMFKSGHHDKGFYDRLWATILAGKTFRETFVNRKKDGHIYYEAETITPIFDDNRAIQYFVGTGKDITERIRMEEELHRYATMDELTGIFNRHKGNELLDAEIERARRYKGSFAVIMFDIDDFKMVNDTYGHEMGDSVLKQLCKVVALHVRKSDAFVRWGGEEFIVLAPHLQEDEAKNFAEKLRAAVASYEFETIGCLTISVGLGLFQEGDDKESVLKRVDDALYQSKAAGRNSVVFL